jgi:hypothetical protein
MDLTIIEKIFQDNFEKIVLSEDKLNVKIAYDMFLKQIKEQVEMLCIINYEEGWDNGCQYCLDNIVNVKK